MAHVAFGIPKDYLWWGLKKMLRSVFENKRTVVQSGHSMSKDYTAGIAAVEWLIKYPFQSKVICSAPKLDQVKLIMFAEINKQFTALQHAIPWPIEGDPMKVLMLELGPNWHAIGMTTKESGGKLGKFQGFKSPNILIVLSEAQSIEDNIFDQVEGMTTSGNAHVLEIGNPIVPAGRFWEHCTQPRFGYNVIKLSCFDSPNVVAGKEVIPGMVTIGWIDDRRKEWGENHPYWQSRVLGEFPQTSKDAIIPLEWIMRAIRDKEFLQEIDPEDCLKVGGLDVSKMGNDETVHLVCTGPKLSRLDPFFKVEINETVGWAKGLIKEEQLDAIAVDEGGLAGICSFLEEDPNIRCAVLRIQFGSTDMDDSLDFANLAAAMWWNLRESFEKQEIFIPDDPILIGQLSQRKFTYTSVGKKVIKLESKRDAKDSGKESPDRGDALAMAWWGRRIYRMPIVASPKFERETHKVQKDITETMGARSMTKGNSTYERESANNDMDIV